MKLGSTTIYRKQNSGQRLVTKAKSILLAVMVSVFWIQAEYFWLITNLRSKFYFSKSTRPIGWYSTVWLRPFENLKKYLGNAFQVEEFLAAVKTFHFVEILKYQSQEWDGISGYFRCYEK